ncbi:MAG: phycobiliprotein lyase [Leptolyngbya sp. SIO1E4]|nr:phycobiliprotein lyase [Leptolyngbya sp. SIO1E4]
MDIVNFFEKVEGTWFSQRTTHFSLGMPSQTAQSTLQIVHLTASDPHISALCQQFAANPDQTAFALRIQQEATKSLYGSAANTPQRTTVLIGLKSNHAWAGAFFSQTEQESATTGQYHLENEVLTLTTVNDQLRSEERLWFMNPNLRMRTSLLKRADGFQMASFCSEVRRSPKT